jgi:hypothetical protein
VEPSELGHACNSVQDPEPMLAAESPESEPLKVYDRGAWAAVQRQANE